MNSTAYRKREQRILLADHMRRRIVLKAGSDLTPTPEEYYQKLLAAGYPEGEAADLVAASGLRPAEYRRKSRTR